MASTTVLFILYTEGHFSIVAMGTILHAYLRMYLLKYLRMALGTMKPLDIAMISMAKDYFSGLCFKDYILV